MHYDRVVRLSYLRQSLRTLRDLRTRKRKTLDTFRWRVEDIRLWYDMDMIALLFIHGSLVFPTLPGKIKMQKKKIKLSSFR